MNEINDAIKKRATEIYTSGKCTLKEAYTKAIEEANVVNFLKGDIPPGVKDIFGKGKK